MELLDVALSNYNIFFSFPYEIWALPYARKGNRVGKVTKPLLYIAHTHTHTIPFSYRKMFIVWADAPGILQFNLMCEMDFIYFFFHSVVSIVVIIVVEHLKVRVHTRFEWITLSSSTMDIWHLAYYSDHFQFILLVVDSEFWQIEKKRSAIHFNPRPSPSGNHLKGLHDKPSISKNNGCFTAKLICNNCCIYIC